MTAKDVLPFLLRERFLRDWPARPAAQRKLGRETLRHAARNMRVFDFLVALGEPELSANTAYPPIVRRDWWTAEKGGDALAAEVKGVST